MNHFYLTRLARLLAGAGLLALAAASHAQPPAPPVEQGPQASDPARWYVEDTTTAAQQRTLRKEIGAALQEALSACKQMPVPQRAACITDARATYQQDLARASQPRPAK